MADSRIQLDGPSNKGDSGIYALAVLLMPILQRDLAHTHFGRINKFKAAIEQHERAQSNHNAAQKQTDFVNNIPKLFLTAEKLTENKGFLNTLQILLRIILVTEKIKLFDESLTTPLNTPKTTPRTNDEKSVRRPSIQSSLEKDVIFNELLIIFKHFYNEPHVEFKDGLAQYDEVRQKIKAIVESIKSDEKLHNNRKATETHIKNQIKRFCVDVTLPEEMMPPKKIAVLKIQSAHNANSLVGKVLRKKLMPGEPVTQDDLIFLVKHFNLFAFIHVDNKAPVPQTKNEGTPTVRFHHDSKNENWAALFDPNDPAWISDKLHQHNQLKPRIAKILAIDTEDSAILIEAIQILFNLKINFNSDDLLITDGLRSGQTSYVVCQAIVNLKKLNLLSQESFDIMIHDRELALKIFNLNIANIDALLNDSLQIAAKHNVKILCANIKNIFDGNTIPGLQIKLLCLTNYIKDRNADPRGEGDSTIGYPRGKKVEAAQKYIHFLTGVPVTITAEDMAVLRNRNLGRLVSDLKLPFPFKPGDFNQPKPVNAAVLTAANPANH